MCMVLFYYLLGTNYGTEACDNKRMLCHELDVHGNTHRSHYYATHQFPICLQIWTLKMIFLSNGMNI